MFRVEKLLESHFILRKRSRFFSRDLLFGLAIAFAFHVLGFCFIHFKKAKIEEFITLEVSQVEAYPTEKPFPPLATPLAKWREPVPEAVELSFQTPPFYFPVERKPFLPDVDFSSLEKLEPLKVLFDD